MSDIEALFLAICLMPAITSLVCIFACELRIQHRDSDTRRFPRPGTHPERPDGFKPFRKHPDMLKPIDKE
jgi:hypothetical protein